MSEAKDTYTVVPFPKARHIYTDSLYLGQRKHTVYGLIEADVTSARQYMRQHKARTGETLSFTALLIACVGRAVERNKYMHAYRNWRGQLVLFDEVDVTSMFELYACRGSRWNRRAPHSGRRAHRGPRVPQPHPQFRPRRC